MENGLGRVRYKDAIQPGVQLLKLGGFNALTVPLRRFGTKFSRQLTQQRSGLALLNPSFFNSRHMRHTMLLLVGIEFLTKIRLQTLGQADLQARSAENENAFSLAVSNRMKTSVRRRFMQSDSPMPVSLR